MKRRKNLTKKQASRVHFKKRARQRYGIKLDSDDVQAIGDMIRRGESQFISKQSNTRTVHKVEFNGSEMIVVYDRLRKTPITALKEEHCEGL